LSLAVNTKGYFADAHIDMANYGRQDPETGLPFGLKTPAGQLLGKSVEF